MGIVGGRRGHARPRAAAAIAAIVAMLGATLSGCADTVDEARTLEAKIGRLHQVVDATVATPTADQAGAISVTYADDVDNPSELAALVARVEAVAAERDYPAHRLALVPSVEPDSTLVVDGGFGGADAQDEVLTTWFTLTDALLGPVTYVVRPDGEAITVDSQGGAAHDLAEVHRIGHGTPRTTWVFRSGAATFTASGRVRAADITLFQVMQRNAGAAGQPASVRDWQLDRRDTHVRLDLDIALGRSDVAPEQLTTGRYARTLAPLVHNALVALTGTGLPAWLRLHHGADVFGSWATDRTPAKGRDPLGRGWDAWLVQQSTQAG